MLSVRPNCFSVMLLLLHCVLCKSYFITPALAAAGKQSVTSELR